MDRFTDVVQDKNGRVISGASVLVLDENGQPADIFETREGTVKANPFPTDSLGKLTFCAADGLYSVQVTVNETLYAILPDIRLDDPEEGAGSGDFGTVVTDVFSGTGAQTLFTLAEAPISKETTQVYVGGEYQEKSTYTMIGTALTFDVAPVAGTNNIEVVTITPGTGAASAITATAPAGQTGTNVQALINSLAGTFASTAAVLASAAGGAMIGITPVGAVAATSVQAAIAELDTEKAALSSLAAGGGAALIGMTPVGSVAATNIQAAIAELASEKTDLTALAASTGATLVGESYGGTASTLQIQLDILRLGITNICNPKFAGGAVLDGVTDCAAARDAAIAYIVTKGGGILYTPPGSALMSTVCTIPDATPMILMGTGPASKWVKGFNGDMISLGKMSTVRDMWIEGNGATYTGRGITIGTGAVDLTSWRNIINCDIVNMASYPVEYTAAIAGFYSAIHNCRLTATAATVAAVKYPASETNGNRMQVLCRCSGPVADLAGSQNTLVAECDGAAPTMTSTTVKARIMNNRLPFSASTPTFTMDGTDTTVVGNVIGATALVFNATMNSCLYIGNTDSAAGSSITDNADGTNRLWLRARTVTPTWTATGGSPAIGNGTLTAKLTRNGARCKMDFRLVMGTTSTIAGTVWQLGTTYNIGFAAAGSVHVQLGANFYSGTAYPISGFAFMQFSMGSNTAPMGSTSPAAWSATSSYRADGSVEFDIA